MSEITPFLWKALNESDDKVCREHARKNYIAGAYVEMLWHPVYLHECYLINKEAGILKEE